MNEKIYSLLIVLNETERKRFLKRYQTQGIKNERLYKFTKYLFNFLPDGNKAGQTPNAKKMHALVTRPDIPFESPSRQVTEYNNYLIDDLLDYIYELREKDFLIEKEINRLAAIQHYPALQELFLQLADKIETRIKRKKYNDIRYYQQLQLLYQIKYEHPTENNLKSKSEAIDKLFMTKQQLRLAELVKYWCEKLNLEKNLALSTTDISKFFSKDAILTFNFPLYSSSYFYQKLIFLFIKENKFSLAQQILSELSSHVKQLRKKEASDISGIFFNICNRLTTTIEGLKFEPLLHEIGCLRYEEQLFNQSEQAIKLSVFINIVICGLQVRTIEWVKDFIKNTAVHLEEPTKELALQIAKTRMEAAQNNYEAAYSTIFSLYQQEMLNRDFMIGLLIRWTLIKSCYELRSTDIHNKELLQKHSHTFRGWLHQQAETYKFPINRVKSYLNGDTYIKKLDKINILDKIERTRFLQEIMSIEHLASRSWFVKKLTEV